GGEQDPARERSYRSPLSCRAAGARRIHARLSCVSPIDDAEAPRVDARHGIVRGTDGTLLRTCSDAGERHAIRIAGMGRGAGALPLVVDGIRKNRVAAAALRTTWGADASSAHFYPSRTLLPRRQQLADEDVRAPPCTQFHATPNSSVCPPLVRIPRFCPSGALLPRRQQLADEDVRAPPCTQFHATPNSSVCPPLVRIPR